MTPEHIRELIHYLELHRMGCKSNINSTTYALTLGRGNMYALLEHYEKELFQLDNFISELEKMLIALP